MPSPRSLLAKKTQMEMYRDQSCQLSIALLDSELGSARRGERSKESDAKIDNTHDHMVRTLREVRHILAPLAVNSTAPKFGSHASSTPEMYRDQLANPFEVLTVSEPSDELVCMYNAAAETNEAERPTKRYDDTAE